MSPHNQSLWPKLFDRPWWMTWLPHHCHNLPIIRRTDLGDLMTKCSTLLSIHSHLDRTLFSVHLFQGSSLRSYSIFSELCRDSHRNCITREIKESLESRGFALLGGGQACHLISSTHLSLTKMIEHVKGKQFATFKTAHLFFNPG